VNHECSGRFATFPARGTGIPLEKR
jgi:hypothetical protein